MAKPLKQNPKRYNRRPEPPEFTLQRFFAKTEDDGRCIIRTGALDRLGYSWFSVKSQDYLAHRWIYEQYVGPIPEGMSIDHLCRNRACVNPEHLEAVDHRTNVLRGVGPTAQNAAKTHCKRGHEFTPENTYVIPSTGGRVCRTCRDTKAWKKDAA